MKASATFITGFYRKCWPLTVPLTLVIVAAVGLSCIGQDKAAYVVANLGTFLAITSAAVYIVAKDSKKRWAGLHWTERLYKLMTFKR